MHAGEKEMLSNILIFTQEGFCLFSIHHVGVTVPFFVLLILPF